MSQNQFDLTGKTAIVTGTGRGIGASIAMALANAGANVVCAARSENEINLVVQDIKSSGGTAMSVVCDASKQADCQDLVATAVDAYGELNIMAVNHGITGSLAAVDITQQELEEVVGVNVNGCFYAAQAAGCQMIKQGHGGSIIMTSSNASITGFPGITSYGISKGAVDQMCRQLATEWGEHNIRVNTVNPGYMSHAMRAASHRNNSAELDAEVIRTTPLKRRGEVTEIAGPVVFLASDAASYITGHSIPVDGGYTIL